MAIFITQIETTRTNGSGKTVSQRNLGNDLTVQMQDASVDTAIAQSGQKTRTSVEAAASTTTTSTGGEKTRTSVEAASTATTTQNQHESAQVSFTIKVQNKTPVATLP